MHIYLIVTTWKNIYKKFIIVSEIKIAKKNYSWKSRWQECKHRDVGAVKYGDVMKETCMWNWHQLLLVSESFMGNRR